MSPHKKIQQILPPAFPQIGNACLPPASWQITQRAFGPHTIVQRDLSVRALPFFALSPLARALVVNVFSQVMVPSYNAYVFPPFVLVGPLIRFLATQGCPYTIVVPDLRPKKYWWPLVVSSCIGSFNLGSEGDCSILLFPTCSSSSMEARPLQWDLWAFRICPVCTFIQFRTIFCSSYSLGFEPRYFVLYLFSVYFSIKAFKPIRLCISFPSP